MLDCFGIHLPPQPVARGDALAGDGLAALIAILDFAQSTIDAFSAVGSRSTPKPLAAVGRLRGRGPGVSFASLVAAIRRDLPQPLNYPFEGSDRVGGAVWIDPRRPTSPDAASLAILRWESRALDLPLHVHDHSDRVIAVLEGRGFFHVSTSNDEEFEGDDVRTVAARERDVFVFRRGTLHTFSTRDSPMTLVSCQLPYLPFDDPRQYRLPSVRWTADAVDSCRQPHDLVCEPAWNVIASRETSHVRANPESTFMSGDTPGNGGLPWPATPRGR